MTERRSWAAPGAAWLCLLLVLHAMGVAPSATYLLTIVSGLALGISGLVINRPKVIRPWVLFAGAGAIWALAGLFGDDNANLANLSRSRLLLPDLLSFIGYSVFAVAFYELLRCRRPGRNRSVVLDGLVLAFGAALIVHHTIIAPTLELENTWIVARLFVAAGPAASIFLFGLAIQLAWSTGPRSVSLNFALLAASGLVVGDMLWALTEVGTISAPTALLELPYLLAPSAMAVATLHPGISDISSGRTARAVNPMGRYIAVSATLIAPSVLVVIPGAFTPAALGLSVALCTASALRIALALHSADASKAALLFQATHDDLTELPTRGLLLEEIDRRLTEMPDEAVAVLFIDLDRFKHVNDLFGHSAGDQLLATVAHRIVAAVRDSDLVARISGDEFVVVTSGLPVHATHRIAERLRIAMAEPFELDTRTVAITASVGISMSESGREASAITLVQEADTAMYESKSMRNDTTMFDATMHDRAQRRLEIEQLLRDPDRAPRFSLQYQPIINKQTHCVSGFEALIRWNVSGEQISPEEFIPIAEETGMIVSIGAFVIDEACRQAAWWRANIPGGSDLTISVNLSPRQICSDGIVGIVANALDRHKLDASALWLEITETVMTENTTTTAAAMTGLRMLGVKLALDDFGTGYSSLASLQFLPVSRLKIDRRFVMGLGTETANDKLVRCIIAVAESFHLDVVAEGIENEQQFELLRSYGCSNFQGYYFSRPVNAEDVPSTFAQHSPATTVRRHRPIRTT
ncbi:MAG: diguanylate cyclase (GGDEF)-like protein [Ilumatobacter sp.]|jgi:diguanylate cyclase (GGDEF)-like protein